MKHFLLLITAILLLTACQHDDEPSNIPIHPMRRTVFVYMSAENNLSSPYPQNDINEMITGRTQVDDDCDLLIYVDRASQREMPFIARISDTVDTLYKYPADFYSSAPDQFAEVLQRMVSLSPHAKDYGLVLWGHANGWVLENDGETIRRAYGVDNGDNSSASHTPSAKWLNIPSMAKALTRLGIRWKFIFCDCCNMQNAEVAYELRNATEYLIASPAEITGDGAPYDIVVKDFFIEDDEQMGIKICEDYNAQYDFMNGHLPISVVNTSRMQALADATRQILPEIADYLKTDNPTKGIIYYYAYDRNDEKEKIMYDMNDMIRAALTNEPEKYQAWKEVLNQTIYTIASTRWHANTIYFSDFTITDDKYGGISMFFPLAKYNEASHPYNKDIRQMQWYHAVGWSSVGW